MTVWHDIGITVTDRRVIVGVKSYRREEITTAGITVVPANKKPAIIMSIVAASAFVLFAGASISLKHIAPLTLFIPAVLMWISAKEKYVVHIFTAEGTVEVFSSHNREAAQQLTALLIAPNRLASAPALR